MTAGTSGGPGALLERSDSVAALGEALAAVRASSEGRLVLVGGEAGVGKTALLRMFCETLTKRVRVLWGGCEPLRTPAPLAPLAEVGEATGGELEELLAGTAKPHEVAMSLLRELRRRAPTVLVLEDVHWADEATLDVLTLLAARIASAPALVLASYRDDELDRSAQLRYVLGELARRPGRLKLDPLSAAAVGALAEHRGIDAEELYRHTGGNPFYVTEVLAAEGEQIPDTVRDAVLARASRLSEPARGLVDVVAVFPGQVDLWLLEACAGELVDRIDECLAAGVLSAGRDHVAFRHELARLAIEEAISPNRRLALHRAALAALTAREVHDPDFARLAHHAEAAGDLEAVIRWAPQAAARAASSGAHREAAALAALALRFADGQSPLLRAGLLQRRADECYMTAEIEEAIDAQRGALECQRQLGDQRGEGDALRRLSRLLFFAGQVGEGERRGLEAVALLEQLPAGHELAIAYANISQRRMVVDEAIAAVVWGTRALELAEALDDTEARIYALTNIGMAELRNGGDQARSKLERALALAHAHGLEDYAGRAYNGLTMFPARYRRIALAREHLDTGLEYCSERGLDTWRLYLLACRARLELDLGHWDDAADTAATVLRDPRTAHLARSWALVVLGLIRARRGDAESAAPLEEARALVAATAELDRITQVAAARAEAAWLSGDRVGVERATDAAMELALRRGAAWEAGELAYVRWQAGVRDELPDRLVAPPWGLSIAGDWTAASALWGEIGCPYEAALALAASEDPAAQRQAIDELRRLGAGAAVAIVSRQLRERGVRGIPRGPRARTRENPAGLTARELQVLALLAEGLRNSQIAERLVVSEKTVDHHVSAILRKLGAGGRTEAAATARRLGLLEPAS
jgi:DNA-binding CsgD family transcriptional regulator/type II secretory pathway predicted ATPase ExeA